MTRPSCTLRAAPQLGGILLGLLGVELGVEVRLQQIHARRLFIVRAVGVKSNAAREQQFVQRVMGRAVDVIPDGVRQAADQPVNLVVDALLRGDQRLSSDIRLKNRKKNHGRAQRVKLPPRRAPRVGSRGWELIGVANGSGNFIFGFRLEPTAGPALFVNGIAVHSGVVSQALAHPADGQS